PISTPPCWKPLPKESKNPRTRESKKLGWYVFFILGFSDSWILGFLIFMSKSTILGVDPGCETTGYGFIQSDGRDHSVIDYGIIRTQRKSDFSLRLRRIHEQLFGLIQRYRPDVAALEDIFYAVNVKSALRLGHARGVILLAAAQADLPVHEYSP